MSVMFEAFRSESEDTRRVSVCTLPDPSAGIHALPYHAAAPISRIIDKTSSDRGAANLELATANHRIPTTIASAISLQLGLPENKSNLGIGPMRAQMAV
ncbi:MAG: hypothetical protein Q7T84_02430 [Phenylobacterium sp.]|uniref:hypothetical protein n=1 Tax=Phenylobacterium sp. TaxID=1871053 RepID=UPI0027278D60|nr:hypothetical protein [Phenylobacterium sp.]MDO9430136.1 hypothetical protein [Phenylobacterium sp.]